jgi:hypothetical protein
MMQLNLTAYGDTPEEILYHLLKLAGQFQAGRPFGRVHALRSSAGRPQTLTTAGKYSVRDAGLAMPVASVPDDARGCQSLATRRGTSVLPSDDAFGG